MIEGVNGPPWVVSRALPGWRGRVVSWWKSELPLHLNSLRGTVASSKHMSIHTFHF